MSCCCSGLGEPSGGTVGGRLGNGGDAARIMGSCSNAPRGGGIILSRTLALQQQQCFAAAVAALLRLILPDGTASVAVELGWKLAQVTTQKNRRQLLQSRATSRAR